MTPSKKLHELIQSLTKAEKRSFKLIYTSKNALDNKIFIRLFDAIDEMKEYDEIKLKYNFKGEVFLKQFTATKYYLYNIILKSLIHTKSLTPNNVQISNLHSISILFDKKLYYHILDVTKSIKQKAFEIENYLAVLDCIKWEQKTINHLPLFKNAYDIQNALSLEKEQIIAEITNQSLYQSFKVKVYALLKDERFFISNTVFIKFQQDFQDTVKNSPPTSNAAKADFHYIQATLDFYYSNFSESKKNYKAILQLLKERPFLTKDPHNLGFLMSAQNYLIAAIKENTFAESEKELIRQLKKTYENDVINYLMVVRLELMYFISIEDYKNAVKLIEENTKYEKELIKNDFYVINGFLFDSILAYFWENNYNTAIKKITQITTFNNVNLPFDLLITIKFIEILAHYKLNNPELVSLFIKSIMKLNKKQNSDFYLNHTLLKILYNILNSSNEAKINQYKKQFITEMESESSKLMIDKLQNYFDLKKWAILQLN